MNELPVCAPRAPHEPRRHQCERSLGAACDYGPAILHARAAPSSLGKMLRDAKAADEGLYGPAIYSARARCPILSGTDATPREGGRRRIFGPAFYSARARCPVFSGEDAARREGGRLSFPPRGPCSLSPLTPPRRCELLLACLAFLVEVVQGPCKANQEYLANLRKPVDVCKNIFCTQFSGVKERKDLTMSIYSKSTQLIAALLESRGSDQSIHLILRDQVPSKMLVQRLRIVNKEDRAMARGLVTARGAERARIKELQSVITSEAISIYNIC
jgi:hypothetical protein